MALPCGSHSSGHNVGRIGKPDNKEMLNKREGRVPVSVHPSFYRSLKLRYLLDVGGISRDDRVTTELGSGSLRRAVGILTPEDFRLVVSNE